MESSNLVNASIIMYISFTFLFFVLKFRFFPRNNYVWILLFLSLSCVFQTIQNISLTSSPGVCGGPDVKLALYSTLVPWILVFTAFILLLMTLPGWLRVFSNTFGVFAAEAYGLKGILNKILKRPTNPDKDSNYLQMLDNIYTDHMALVVEMNIDDVTDGETFDFPALNKLVDMKIIQGTMTGDKYTPDEQETINNKELYKALLLRENVGFFFWFLLIGIFCILVSTNTLLSSGCTPTIGGSYEQIFSE